MIKQENDPPFAKRLTTDERLYQLAQPPEYIVPHLASPAIEGYFRFPAIWVGSAPDQNTVTTLNPSVHHREMLTQRLSCGIVAQARQNGMFLFDFSDWHLGPMTLVPGYTKPTGTQGYKIPLEHTRAEARAEEIAILRARVMNVHMACMATAETQVKRRSGGMGFPISAWNTHKAMSFTLPTYYFDDIEDPLALAQNVMDNKDKVNRATPLPRRVQELEVVSRSYEILDDVLKSPHPATLQLIESLYLASFRFRDKFFGEAVTLGWTVCEQLISLAWKQYLEEIDAMSSDNSRMPKERRNKLLGKDYTASMMVEGLEFAKIIDHELYRLLEIARKSRNKWAHELKVPQPSQALMTIRAAEALLELILGLKINLQHSGRGSVPLWPLGLLFPEMRKKVR